MILLI